MPEKNNDYSTDHAKQQARADGVSGELVRAAIKGGIWHETRRMMIIMIHILDSINSIIV